MSADEERTRDPVRITLTGVDRPGITAELASILADAGASLIDVQQMVVESQLHLQFLVSLPGGECAARPVLKDVLWKARELGLSVDFDFAPSLEARLGATPTWALTVLANPVTTELLATIARTTHQSGFNIERISRLSSTTLASAEFLLSGPVGEAERALRTGLVALREKFRCDLALQRETLTRRNKRLIVMDMDSTLIQQEVIDELAVTLGVQDKVSEITERAMNGELDFDQSLRERVRLLKGTPQSALADVLARIQLTPGAEQLVRILKRLGYRTAVISGGFIEVVEPIRKQLGLDYAFANTLEIENGVLTGEVLGTIVNRKRKAELLESIARAERVELDQVIAVGDGANDLDMLHRAGLGIAFNAKRTVQEQAATAINQQSLVSILYLLGMRDADTMAFEAPPESDEARSPSLAPAPRAREGT
ncbi:MAG: phosphoserine phosphatase SerB [Polyangiales bacterium]